MRHLFIFFLSFLPFSSWADTPFVTCWICGQLGNEMCQIATTLAYAWDHNVRPIFPELNNTISQYPLTYHRDRFFFRLDTSSLPRPTQIEYLESIWWLYSPIPYYPDQYLRGIFFNWKHFHHHRDKLIQVFAPSQEIENYLQQKYGWLLEYPKTVSVHVRTYSPEAHYQYGFPFVGLEYYEKAMDFFPKDTIFVIFSDRINWCKKHFSRFDKTMIFAEGNDHIEDFFLMSKMKDHIIGNSEFSWWAAYLDSNPNKIVVAPRYWYFPNNQPPIPQEGTPLLFPDWILLDFDRNAPYPTDMRQYDERSTSVDTP